MLCEVIAYILSRQRLSAKTFVTGCVFYALQDRLSLWLLCDTSGVGKLSVSPSHGFSLRASPAVTHGVSPAGDSGCGLGGFSFLSLSTSPLLHGFTLRASPAVTYGVSPPGTVGADWEASLFSPLLHGVILRASPAVTHGVSPLGTVDAGLIIKSLYSLRG